MRVNLQGKQTREDLIKAFIDNVLPKPQRKIFQKSKQTAVKGSSPIKKVDSSVQRRPASPQNNSSLSGKKRLLASADEQEQAQANKNFKRIQFP